MRPAGGAPSGRAVACLLALAGTLAACSLGPGAPERGAPPPAAPPPRLEAVVGAVVEGEIGAGERHVFPLDLDEGTYFEIHLDRPQHDVGVHLFEPGVDLGSDDDLAYATGMRSTRHPGQLLWQVTTTSGEHQVRLDGRTGSTPYRLEVLTLRPASPSEWGLHTGLAIWDQAEALVRHSRFEDALEKFLEARALFLEGGYHVGVGTGFRQEGWVSRALGRLERARAAYHEAAEYGRRHGDLLSEIRSWTALADLALSAGEWESAERHLDTARTRAAEERDRWAEADVLDHYCRFYKDQGSWELAVERCEEALRIRRELDLDRAAATPLVLLGQLYSRRGDLETSERYYREAAAIFEDFPDPDWEGVIHNDLAVLYRAEGRYLEATLSYERALAAYEAQGEVTRAARVLFNMGTAYEGLGQIDKTLELYREALRRMEGAGDLSGRILVLDGIAWVLREIGDLEGAQRVLDEVLQLGQGTTSRPQRASFLQRRGEIQLDLGEPEAALASLEEAQDLYQATGRSWRVAHVLKKIAAAHAELGQDDRALEVLHRAAAVNAEVGETAETADCFFRIAEAKRRLGELEGARTAIRRALALVDHVRGEAGSEEIQALYAATVQPYHELLVELLMEEHRRDPAGGYAAEALRESERRKAQTLRQIIGESELGLDQDVPEALRERRAALRTELEAIATERQRLRDLEEPPEADLFAVQRDLDRSELQLQEIEHRIRETSPRYAALIDPDPVSLGEIQASLLDAETALLEYSVGEERSYLWLVTQSSFRTYELSGRGVIEPSARCVHRLITAYGEPPAAEDVDAELASCLGPRLEPYRRIAPDRLPIRVRGERRDEIELAYDRIAAGLAEAVLGAAARDGALPRRLAVVSDGALEYVPFAALPMPAEPTDPTTSSRLVIDDHEIVRLPSASVLAVHRRQRIGPDSLPPGLVAIVADPVYGPDDPRVRREEPAAPAADADPLVPQALRPLRRLDLSGDEAETIASLVPADRRLVIEGFDATRERVSRGDLGRYLYVHFATHGQVDTEHPKLSSLVLSRVDETGEIVDSGHLRLHDIYALDLDDVDMVVLSACETALGREVRGEGLMGLTRGFLYAGADRVAATLWQVQDLMTAELMKRFYSALFEQDRAPADALRQAQLAIRDADDGAHSFPYYWAGFVLQGEWR